MAHIGVIKELAKHNIPIDCIAGTSAGAIIGGLYAAWKDIERIENLASKLNYQNFLDVFSDPLSKSGLFKGEKAERFLSSHLVDTQFEDLLLPFTAVTTDVVTGQRVLLSNGSLTKAMRASSSIPFLFQPVEIEGKYLVDGAIACPVPVDVVRNMGADIVISVNLYSPTPNQSIAKEKPPSTFSVVKSSILLLLYHLAVSNEEKADFAVNPEIPNISLTEFVGGQKYIKKGEECIRKIIPDIKQAL